jgi:alpha-L-fucosidase
MKFDPTLKSLKQHMVPQWYQDAKLGIFIHWGLYSVPGYAPTQYGDITQTVGERGFEFHFSHNPYAEWYQNSLRTKGEDYVQYHERTFGSQFPYENFASFFNEQVKHWNPQEWAELFQKIGAKYVVLTTKHHEGFLLWPSFHTSPHRPGYQAIRNIVGELATSLRKVNLKVGLYYSGGLDWTFSTDPILDTTTMLSNTPSSKEYGEYVDQHYRELIDTFKPDILWNDIAYPIEGQLHSIIAYYYNQIPDGVVNDRWSIIPKSAQSLHKSKILRKLVNKVGQNMVKHQGFEGKPPKNVGDYSTPEYEPNYCLRLYKWESCRGIGRSFGFNRMETEEHYLTSTQLIHMFVDIVSKNGNLLLDIGPQADGTIPPLQRDRLLALGAWLEKNGEGIFSTRPWIQPESITNQGIPVRFTQKNQNLYIFLLGNPNTDQLIIEKLNLPRLEKVQVLGEAKDLDWEQTPIGLKIHYSPQPITAVGFRLIQHE